MPSCWHTVRRIARARHRWARSRLELHFTGLRHNINHPTQTTDPHTSYVRFALSFDPVSLTRLCAPGVLRLLRETMPTAARRAAVKARAAANEKPRPPGTAPHDFPIWDGQRGVWTNAAGGASPSTALVQHRHDKRKVVRQKERRADRAKAADPSRPRGSAPHDFPI